MIKVSPLIEEIINNFFNENDVKSINKYVLKDEYPYSLRGYLGQDEAPKRMNYGKGLYCLRKAPELTKIGSGTVEAAGLICKGCKAKINLEDRWKQIIAKDKHGFVEHTYCAEGGAYDPKTGRIQCRETDYQGKRIWHDMDKCFTYFKGGRCPSLKTLPARPIKKTGIRRRDNR